MLSGGHYSALYFVYLMRLSLHISIHVLFHPHIHVQIHVLFVVAVVVLIVIVVIVLQVEVDTTSWNSCIAACAWQIGFHLLRQMQDIKLERCAHTYDIYLLILYHIRFLLGIFIYIIIYMYNTYVFFKILLKEKKCIQPGFAELQILQGIEHNTNLLLGTTTHRFPRCPP